MHAYVQPMLQGSRHTVPLMPYTAAHSMRDSGKVNALDDVVALGRVRIVTEGTAIHRAGDAFRSVFYVKSGAAKRVLIQEDGREQILGFPMPGTSLRWRRFLLERTARQWLRSTSAQSSKFHSKRWKHWRLSGPTLRALSINA